jgi:hypothetical protein
MAEKRSISQIGDSLLSAQSSSRKDRDKKQRKQNRATKFISGVAAVGGIYKSALKNRATELADFGTLSKLKSKTQAASMNAIAPFMKAFDPYETAEDFYADRDKNPAAYNQVKFAAKPYIQEYVKKFSGSEMGELEYEKQYHLLEDVVLKKLIEGGFKNKEKFSKGMSKMYEEQGYDPSNKAATWDYFTTINKDDIDISNSRILSKRIDKYSGSPLDMGNLRNLGSAVTFGAIKKAKGQENIFEEIEEWQGLSKDITQTLDSFNVNQIISKTVRDNMGTSINYEVQASLNKDETIIFTQDVWDTYQGRINKGIFKSNDRFSKVKEDRIDNLVDEINETGNKVVKDNIINKSQALDARMFKDAEFKKVFIDSYVKEFNIKENSEDYQVLLSKLNSAQSRKEIALDFVISQSVIDKSKGWDVGGGDFLREGNNFDYNFNTIDSLIKPAFTVSQKDGNLDVEAASYYSDAVPATKQKIWDTHVLGILQDRRNTQMKPAELQQVAIDFISAQPSPNGLSKSESMDRMIELLRDSYSARKYQEDYNADTRLN